MKIRTFVVGYVLALALLVFANRRSEVTPGASFRTVVDLTNSSSASTHTARSESGETRIEAPSSYSPKLWSVDQIPGERLVGPLAIINVNEASPVSLEDLVRYEQNYGRIPVGSVVLARTRGNNNSPADFSDDAVKFLVHARNAIGLGVETQSAANSDPDKYALAHSAYLLSNVSNLGKVPAAGSMVMVAPSKLRGASNGPVRVLALLR